MAATDPWLRLGRGFEPLYEGLTDGSREVHVAVDGEALLGVIALNLRGPFVGYIQAICVTEAARGRGVGTELVAFAEERIFREWPNVFLCVSSFNERARALYERLGYEQVGLLRDYLVRGYDEILMRKSLAPLSEFHAQ
jgi:ribosomal protein S18 acetylase RimI-like enzyme